MPPPKKSQILYHWPQIYTVQKLLAQKRDQSAQPENGSFSRQSYSSRISLKLKKQYLSQSSATMLS